jgi:N-acetylglucosaminyl-diphospho-decaprenol L-rhamnosyltransferase
VDLSALIVNWNTRDLLRRCLLSLRETSRRLAEEGRTLETIVVDNASADGSAAMVAAEFPEVRLIANAENRNYAAGSNQALEVAQGDFLLLLNPDTELPAGAARALLRFLEERPAAAAVAPALVHPDGRVQISVRGFPAPAALVGELTGLGRLFPRSRWGSYRPAHPDEGEPALVDQPMTSCLLLRRAALAAVGGFDEQFPLFFNDVDLCYRLRAAGWEIWYDPRVRVLHQGGASTRQVRPEAIRLSHRGLLDFYRKHYRAHMGRLGYAAAASAIVAAGIVRSAWARLTGTKGDEADRRR